MPSPVYTMEDYMKMNHAAVQTVFIFSMSLILVCSTFSSYAGTGDQASQNTPLVTFISKSTGLETPAKEGGRTELELADINNDGHLDVICVGDHGSPYINSNQHGIMVWFGDGNGTWSVHQVGNFGYGGIQAGDLNLDGHLDVVWGIHHNYGPAGFGDTLIGAALGDSTGTNWIPWATGLGTGGETYGMFATDLADFNCDGKLDLVSLSFGCCNGYHLYQNHGDGTWSHQWALTGGNANYNIKTCDINADGYPDFVGTREGAYVFLGDGNFGFTMNHNGLPAGSFVSIDAEDINNDGCDDIVFGYSSSGVRCFLYNKQSNQWVSASSTLPTTGYYYVQFGDVNGDGFVDILAYSAPTIRLYLGDGTGNWVADATLTLPTPGYYSALRVDGDFDHDGREDVLIQAEQGSWPSYQNVLRAYSPWLTPATLTVYVKSPTGGETLRSNSIRTIRWLSAVPPAEGESTVDIQFSSTGSSGPWRTIASGLPNNGCYQWHVDGSGSTQCRIKILVTTSSSTVSAISNADFTIIGFNAYAHGPYQGPIGQPISFTGSAENGTAPYQYHWDFGDGGTADEQNPTHTYDTEGNFTVTLTVTDNTGCLARDTTWALVGETNQPPQTPVITGPASGKAGVEYTFFFQAIDPDGDDVSYYVEWDDGTITDWTVLQPSGVDCALNHTWDKRGTYVIRCKAKDIFNQESDWGTMELQVPKMSFFVYHPLRFIERIVNTFLLFRYMLVK